MCKTKHLVGNPDQIAEKVAINLSILKKVEFEEDKDQQIDRYSISKDQAVGLNVELPDKFKCSKHRQLVHSYVTSNNVLMCSKCIDESDYADENIQPLPQIIKQMNADLYSASIKKKQCLTQMKMCSKLLEIYYEKRKDMCRTKIHSHFAQLFSMIKDEELKALADLERKSQQEFQQLTKVFDEVKLIKQNIQNDIKTIDNLLTYDGKSKIACTDLITKFRKQTNEYYKTIDFPSQHVGVVLDDPSFVSVKEAVKKSIKFETSELTFNEQKQVIRTLFSVDVVWYCHRCKNKNSVKKSPIE